MFSYIFISPYEGSYIVKLHILCDVRYKELVASVKLLGFAMFKWLKGIFKVIPE